MMNRGFRILVAGILATGLTACETVPETGRSQLLLINSKQEIKLGLTEFEKLKKNTPISEDKKKTALVNRVGRRIASVAKLPGAQWEFVLFEKPKIANAFSLPGGKVGIYSGILPITKTETGLATVMTHEIAHAVARHGAERISEGMLVQLGGQVLSILTQEKSAEAQSLINSSYGIGSQLGVMLPHSRKQELEADYIGILYMARAGYPPKEAIAFWKRFSQNKGNKKASRLNEFFSTHPVDKIRIQQLQKLLPRAQQEYQRALQNMQTR
ncbi:MAG: M48 family metallopeptidase [Gammaproteobacteria bacterium]|nr:MAG: M48 family metallopeptidase [Gammaproteobacteria bacterium]